MGLFSLLKNGLTIEKKKKEPEVDVTETEDDDEIESDETTTEEVEETEPSPEIDVPQTPEEKKRKAEYILYGNTNPVSTPAPVAPVETVTETPAPIKQTFNAYSNISNFNNALLGQTSANQNLLVISPKSPDEISAILSNLASGNACIVSLANISDAQRHLDYICGFMNAIGGTIMQRTQTEYILTPKGVGIKS